MSESKDVAIIMGSDSDWPVIEEAGKVEDALKEINEEAKAKGAQLSARRNQKTGF